MNLIARYWIHGPKFSGKTILAQRIAGDGAEHISARSTQTAIERILTSSKSVIIDEFIEKKSTSPLIMAAGVNGSLAKGTTDGSRSVQSIRFDLDSLIVISEKPPKDSALGSRFIVIRMDSRVHERILSRPLNTEH